MVENSLTIGLRPIGARDAHIDVATEIRVPQVDRRQAFGFGDLPQQVVGFLRATHGVLLEFTGC
jgi:hypothetical protein